MNLTTLYKTVRYLMSERPLPLEKPTVLQFPVIDICNSQCQMCRIWENKKSDDLTPEQLRHGLRNPLFSEVTAIGLNGGEPTLRKDLGALTSVLFEELPKLQSISLISNAYKYEEVIARITDVGEVVKKHNGVLDVMVSLDGYGEVHDKVRGKPGNFERAQHVVNFAQSSPLVNNVRIGCTIIKENVYGLSDLFEFCQAKGLYIKYRLGIPHQRLYTQNLLDPYALNAAEKYHIAEFLEGLIKHYEPNESQRFFYRSLIDQIISGASRKAGCDWQHRGATITSKGELLYCAVQSKALGNITTQDSERLYFGNEDHLKSIIKNHCDSCNHDYVGIPPKKQHTKQFVLQVAKKLRAENLLKSIYQRWASSAARQNKHFSRKLNTLRQLREHTRDWPGNSQNIRVLICGWYGTETLGDKGILGGVIQALREYLGDIDVVLVSLFPYVSEMTRRQMNDLNGVHIVKPEQGVQLAAKANLVVFGGGPLMAINETADMLAIFETAKKAEVKTLIAGCGVGPLGANWHNETIGLILKTSDARIFRDELSRDIASNLGIETQADLVAEDPAFTWLQTQNRIDVERQKTETNKVLLLGLRDFPYETYAKHLNKAQCLEAKHKYETAVIDALNSLVAKFPDLTIRPLPMCTNHYGDDDRWFYRRLFRNQTTIKPHLDLSLLGAELTPVEYCTAFKQSTASLTMRFHSVVFSLGLGTPTVAIDYTLRKGKVHALADRFGVPARSLDELDASFIVREISNLLEKPNNQATNFKPTFTKAMAAALHSLNFPERIESEIEQ
ncbi:MAG: polysaccharide pyruvyl transferase family protein [Limnobacter sp.]|uniref:polysaccharide pyruvyl transferase family protein n=1 Tax=Limnobacter sp. TaxID=2003368 RepID=UPI0030024A18